jgi:hypothetical protein
MGAKNSKKNDLEKTSISSVYEKSLNSNSSPENPSLNKASREDLINEIKEEINLPLENEFNESPEIIFEEKGQSHIQNYFFNDGFFNSSKDNDIILNKFYPADDLYNMKRSKTFVPKPVILETPRLHSKDSENINFMSPFKLSIKSFGIVPKINQKPNKILLDFQKDIMDCKSCNDNEEEIFEEYLLFSADTEKTTPNPEDLQDLLNCRKKMIKFRNSINYSPYCEYENILNCEKMLNEIQDENEIKHGKKKSMWNKYIKDQLDKEKNKNYFEHDKRLYSEPFPDVEINCDNFNCDEGKQDEKEKDSDNEEGLFILGVIERAAKERKRTKSVVVK